VLKKLDGTTPQAGPERQSWTYQLNSKWSQLALIPPIEPLEDNSMVGSSNGIITLKKNLPTIIILHPLSSLQVTNPTGYYFICCSNYVSTYSQYWIHLHAHTLTLCNFVQFCLYYIWHDILIIKQTQWENWWSKKKKSGKKLTLVLEFSLTYSHPSSVNKFQYKCELFFQILFFTSSVFSLCLFYN